jgi:hypothetical protein
VVTCFALYSGTEIVSQGSFQVLEDVKSNTFYTEDGCALTFTHSHEGASCSVSIACDKADLDIDELYLDIPINRAKQNWKQTKLGPMYDLYYRSGLE